MARVTDPSTPTKNPLTSPTSPVLARAALRWTDPADARVWLDAVRTELDDATAYAREATATPRKRTFTRRYLRRMLDSAMTNLVALVNAAERGLPRNEASTEP